MLHEIVPIASAAASRGRVMIVMFGLAFYRWFKLLPPMFDQFIGTKPVEERHRLDVPRLEAYLRERVEGFRGPLEIEQFKGGQSNPTYRLSAGGRRYALRRKPPGKLLPSAHAVDREYRVIQALYGVGFPVARPYVL